MPARPSLPSLISSLEAALHVNRQYMLQAEGLATSKERHRLATEVHDTVNYHLPGIHINLGAVALNWDTNPAAAQELLVAAQQGMKDLQGDVSRSVRDLRADYLLKPIQRLLQDLAAEIKLAGINVHLRMEGILHDPPDVIKTVLYRITQELLSNVRKHAQAHNVNVVYDCRDATRIHLNIHDDGVGAATTNTGGIGVIGMRERVASLGGLLTIETQPGQGFKITVEVPVE